jgi:hypothetical protein
MSAWFDYRLLLVIHQYIGDINTNPITHRTRRYLHAMEKDYFDFTGSHVICSALFASH